MSAALPALSKLSRLQSIAPAHLGHSVLVVEDSKAIRELLCGYLRQIGGFMVETADSLAGAGRLRSDNVEGLALLSHLYADCRDLAEQLAAEGWMTSTDKGQQANPVARLLRDARRDFVSLAREYGLTPAAETRFPPEATEHGEEDAEEAALRAFCG